jgi:N-acetylneuraminic acid mutarotase
MLLAVGLSNSHAQDTWTRKADFGGRPRYLAVAFSIDSKGFIGTGVDCNGFLHSDFWEFDASTNTWTQKADFGGTARVDAVGFSIGSKGYIGTGYYPSGKDFWEYDPATNAWTQKTDFGGTARSQAVGFSIGSKGYIGTGVDSFSDILKDFWEYDPIANIWTQRADVGETGRTNATGFSIGAKGYIGTGSDGASVKKDFWQYDPATNTWTQKADFGGGVRSLAVGFSIGSKGYIGTGYDDVSYYKDFWEYDPATNNWTQKADFGGTARFEATGFSISSKGYIGTGYDVNGTCVKDFWEYTPAGDAAYRDVILADSPIMYWRLGETSGTIVYDESANHRDARYLNNTGLGVPGAIADDPNTAAGFHGIHQYVKWIPASSYSGAFTVEAWVKEKKRVQPVETFFSTRTKTAEFSFDFKFDVLAGREIHFDVGDGPSGYRPAACPSHSSGPSGTTSRRW